MPKGIYTRKVNNGFQKGHTINLGKKRAPIIINKCFLCGKIYTPKNHGERGITQKFCSISCGMKSHPSGRIGIGGERHGMWIKDRSLVKHQEDRNNPEYKQWRLKVYKRDNYKCVINNCDCSGRIIAHHILSFTYYPELRYEINNGITLCKFHHPIKREEERQSIPIFNDYILSLSK